MAERFNGNTVVTMIIFSCISSSTSDTRSWAPRFGKIAHGKDFWVETRICRGRKLPTRKGGMSRKAAHSAGEAQQENGRRREGPRGTIQPPHGLARTLHNSARPNSFSGRPNRPMLDLRGTADRSSIMPSINQPPDLGSLSNWYVCGIGRNSEDLEFRLVRASVASCGRRDDILPRCELLLIRRTRALGTRRPRARRAAGSIRG